MSHLPLATEAVLGVLYTVQLPQPKENEVVDWEMAKADHIHLMIELRAICRSLESVLEPVCLLTEEELETLKDRLGQKIAKWNPKHPATLRIQLCIQRVTEKMSPVPVLV